MVWFLGQIYMYSTYVNKNRTYTVPHSNSSQLIKAATFPVFVLHMKYLFLLMHVIVPLMMMQYTVLLMVMHFIVTLMMMQYTVLLIVMHVRLV